MPDIPRRGARPASASIAPPVTTPFTPHSTAGLPSDRVFDLETLLGFLRVYGYRPERRDAAAVCEVVVRDHGVIARSAPDDEAALRQEVLAFVRREGLPLVPEILRLAP